MPRQPLGAHSAPAISMRHSARTGRFIGAHPTRGSRPHRFPQIISGYFAGGVYTGLSKDYKRNFAGKDGQARKESPPIAAAWLEEDWAIHRPHVSFISFITH